VTVIQRRPTMTSGSEKFDSGILAPVAALTSSAPGSQQQRNAVHPA
jgi:hypothetical protein